jgi:hypothetical protein
MPNDQPNGNGQSRLDRMEGLMNLLIEDHVRFDEEHKRLLTAQIILTDRIDKLAIQVDKTAAAVREVSESQRHSDERLNALIAVVDDLVRKRPPPQLSSELSFRR